jgi:hypothetical protein
VLITRPPFASTDWGAFYFIMEFKIRLEVAAENNEAELTIDIYKNEIVFTDSNGIDYIMTREDANVLIMLLENDLTK